MSRDIIIHYDETAGKIVCSTVDHTLTAPLLEDALPLETDVSHFKSQNPDEAERLLGAGVFALLDISAQKKIGLRDYKNGYAKIETEITVDLQQRSAMGNAEAQYELALQLVAEGLRWKSKRKMQEAEDLLKKAAGAGYVEAVDYLTDLWPALKARYGDTQ